MTVEDTTKAVAFRCPICCEYLLQHESRRWWYRCDKCQVSVYFQWSKP